MKKPEVDLQLEIIERQGLGATPIPFAAMHVFKSAKVIYWSRKAAEQLGIEKGASVIFSISGDQNLYIALDTQVTTSSRKSYTFSVSRSSGRSTAVPSMLRDYMEDGYYKINLEPVYQKGYDWFLCEKVELNT